MRKKENIIEEKLLENFPSPVTIEKTSIILEQMKKCICKISNRKGRGTGFFCLIPFQKKKLTVLMTNNHVIDEEIIKENSTISVTINNDKETKNIEIKKKKIYTSKEYDTTIIEIMKEKDNINDFLDLDENLINGNFNLIKENIYIIHYPKNLYEQEASVSYGILYKLEDKYNINHLCSTCHGSSGSPIIKMSNNKVIGIHNQASKNNDNNSELHKNCIKLDFNYGKVLKAPIIEFLEKYGYIKKKSNIIDLTIKIEKKDIDKEIYFLDNNNGCYDENNVKRYHDYLKELNENNVNLYIDDKKYNYQKYFIFNKEGEHYIKLELQTKIKDCSFMFFGCKNIISIDLSSFDSSETTNMSGMFSCCHNLTSLNISNLNTEKVTNMISMFAFCNNLKNLDLSDFNTNNVTNMKNMFYHCENLLNLDLSSFNTEKVIYMNYMFSDCINLINLDLSSFCNDNLKDKKSMFSLCEKLNLIKVNKEFYERIKNEIESNAKFEIS